MDIRSRKYIRGEGYEVWLLNNETGLATAILGSLFVLVSAQYSPSRVPDDDCFALT